MASAGTIDRLARASSIVAKVPGPILFDAEPPARVAVLVRGTVVAAWNAPDGRSVYSGLYGPRQFFGMSTLSGGPMTVGVDAVTDVVLLVWRSEEFRDIASSDFAMTLDLLDRAIYSIQALNHLIKVRAFTTARSRLAALLMQYEPFCFSKAAPLAPRGQLSSLAGVTPRMVATILAEWEADGIVRRVGRKGLELVDRSALEAEAAPFMAFPAPDPTSPGAWTIPTLEVAH